MSTTQIKQRFAHWHTTMVCAALVFASQSVYAQSSTAPAINRLARWIGGLLPIDVVIPILAFAIALFGLLLWTGHVSKSFFFAVLGGGIIVGAAAWLANQAVSLGGG